MKVIYIMKNILGTIAFAAKKVIQKHLSTEDMLIIRSIWVRFKQKKKERNMTRLGLKTI